MNRFLHIIISVLLTLTILAGTCTTTIAADAQSSVMTFCGGTCAFCPTILIPGNFQSPSRLLDDNGNDVDCTQLASGLYADLSARDIARYLSRLLVPLTLTLVLQTDAGLSAAVGRVAADVFKKNIKDNEGRHVCNVQPVRYPHSLAQYSPQEKAPIYEQFPLEGYADLAGEDHLYFFAYDSFGSISALADELYAFIQNVKKETGHDKVNLVPVSQGGTVACAMIERYRAEMTSDLHRIVLAVPALDGSYLLGKIFNNGINTQDSFLYRDAFPFLFGDSAAAYALNLAIRLLPKAAVIRTVDNLAPSLRPVIVNSSCMWALTPGSEYDALFARYMTDGTREKVREDVQFAHRAQTNVRSNLLYLQSAGVEIFDLVDYGGTFYPLFAGWEAYNADGIIQLDSTSGGAISCPVTETLPADYVQQNTYCTCGGSHISPDRRVDASAGFLCETTFYFAYGDHIVSAFNDVFMRLAIALLTDDHFRSVHTYPDRFPQFNTARQGGFDLQRTIRDVREKVDTAARSQADAAELTAAIGECEQVLDQTVVDRDAFTHAVNRLDAILVRIGYKDAPKQPSAAQAKLTDLLHELSDRLYQTLGGCGFSDVLTSRFRR